MLGHYKMSEDGQINEIEDVLEWAEWFETANRTIARTRAGWSVVSTVFLGLDHNFSHKGPPVLFETLVFSGPPDGEMERYTTLDESRMGHERMIARVQALSVFNFFTWLIKLAKNKFGIRG